MSRRHADFAASPVALRLWLNSRALQIPLSQIPTNPKSPIPNPIRIAPGLRSMHADLRERTDCSPPSVSGGAARGGAGRGCLGVGACAGQGLAVHSQPAGAVG